MVGVCHLRLDLALGVGQAVRLSVLFQDPGARSHGHLDLLLRGRVGVGVLAAGICTGQGGVPGHGFHDFLGNGDLGHRVLGLVCLPVIYHDFPGIDLCGQAVGRAQFGVKVAVRFLRLLHALDSDGFPVHVPHQLDPGPLGNLLADLLDRDVFPVPGPLGVPKAGICRDGHPGQGARHWPAGEIVVVQDKEPTLEAAALSLFVPVLGFDCGGEGVAFGRQPCRDPLAVPVIQRNVHAVRLSACRVGVGELAVFPKKLGGNGGAVVGDLHSCPSCFHRHVLQIGRPATCSLSGRGGV